VDEGRVKRRPDASSNVLTCSFRATRFHGQNREHKAAFGTDLADHDEHPPFSVEGLTLAGPFQQNSRNAWLILIDPNPPGMAMYVQLGFAGRSPIGETTA
jgi:hypothetical protein